MSVEVLEERAIEAPAVVERETQQERCATLGGAAIACAGCPFVRFCEIKAEVQQGSFTNETVENSSEQIDDIFGLSEFESLFPEVDSIQEAPVDAVQQPEKITTPLPYEVKNTTISYIDKLMDDKVEVVFANSITNYRESSDSNLAPEPPINLAPTEVEQPISILEVPVESVKIEAQDVSEALELAYEDVEMVELTPEVAPADRADPIADRPVDPEIIANKEIAQIEEIIKPTKDLTENILRPKVSVVKKVVLTEPIQKIKKTETIVSTIITGSSDSPIFYNDDFEEIVDEKEEPVDVEFGPEPEFEAELDYTAEAVDVIEILEKAVATEGASEVVELIQVEAVKQPEDVSEHIYWTDSEFADQPQPESRLSEALLNGNDDTVDPESHLVSRKITNKLKILHQLALRALRFSL